MTQMSTRPNSFCEIDVDFGSISQMSTEPSDSCGFTRSLYYLQIGVAQLLGSNWEDCYGKV